MNADRWPGRRVRVGAFGFHIRSPIAGVIADVDRLYRDYPLVPADEVVDFMVAVRPASRLRRFVRPKIVLECDIEIPFMAPLPLDHAILAIEMGMNLQLAAGMQRYLLLHAGAVARGDDALLLSGDSGAGKSTLTAMLGHRDWRFMGDEFAMLDPATGLLRAMPRPISLKNQSIALLESVAPADRFGPRMEETIKGAVRHLAPPAAALAEMDRAARPRVLVVPNFNPAAPSGARPLDRVEIFAQLAQSSTNYWKLGETGFNAAWALADRLPGYEIVYGSTDEAAELIDTIWSMHD